MIAPLLRKVSQQGFKTDRVDGGFIVSLPKVNISVGKHPENESFMVNVWDYRAEDAAYASFDDHQEEDVLALLDSYRPTEVVSTESPELS